MDDATQKLVDGLRLDARDYGRKMRGEVPPEELISWDQSHVRAWEAADALEAAQRRAEEDHAEANRLVNEYAVKAGNLALALEAAQRPPVAEPDNHHNADVCPFCTRNREEREAAIRAEALAQRPPVNPVVEAIDAARDSIARGELASVVIDTDDYPQRPPVSENARDLVDDLRESAAQSYEELSQATIDVLNRAADYISRPPVSPEVEDALVDAIEEAWTDDDPEFSRVIARRILARFSVPSQRIYDEEAIARFLAELPSGYVTDDGQEVPILSGLPAWNPPIPEYIAAALAAALRGGELTREETNRG